MNQGGSPKAEVRKEMCYDCAFFLRGMMTRDGKAACGAGGAAVAVEPKQEPCEKFWLRKEGGR